MGELIRLVDLAIEGFGDIDTLEQKLIAHVEHDAIGFRCVPADIAADMFTERAKAQEIQRERERQRLEKAKAANARDLAKRAAIRARQERQAQMLSRNPGMSACELMVTTDGQPPQRSERLDELFGGVSEYHNIRDEKGYGE